MLSALSCNFSAFIIITILLILNTIKERRVLRPDMPLFLTLCTHLLTNIFSCVKYFAEYNGMSGTMLHTVFTYMYIIGVCSVTFFTTMYLLSLTYMRFMDFSRRRKIHISLPFLLMVFLVLITPCTDLLFRCNGTDFSRTPITTAAFALYFIYYSGLIVYALVRYRKSILRPLFYTITLLLLISCGSIIVQTIHNTLLIYNFGTALGLLIVYLTSNNYEDNYDPILGVYNRHAFSVLTDQAETESHDISMLIIHIENVDLLNRKFGDKNVDYYIFRNFAIFLTSEININVFYINDCTFAVLFNKEELAEVDDSVDKITERLKHPWTYDYDNQSEIILSAMTGVIHFPEDADSIFRVFDFIDYVKHEKTSANDKTVVYAKEMEFENAAQTLKMKTMLKNALAHTELFEIEYQPIYSTLDKQYHSAEALLRINDPEYGIVYPDEFIPVAEANGMIIQIGIVVFEKVCRFYSENRLWDKNMHFININLSIIQCMYENLYDIFSEIMYRYQVDPNRINLEITESAIAQTPKMLQINMTALFNHGVRFTLDDYGTGYSSVSRLVDLPFETIKMDKSMLWATNSYNQKAIIAYKSSVRMLQEMNLSVVAEGVETQAQVDFLNSIGCDFMQGYYFTRPMSAPDLLKFIDEHLQ